MSQLIPLAMVSPGKMVQVVGVRFGWGLRRKLADMGLTPGVTVRVLNNQIAGPVIIDLRGSRLALGRGMTQRVLVKEL
jgi:ferrous iron transport protein A